jgi:acyl-CoA synthetase (AMP-forming)/AMP-acid ligase II
MEALVANDGRRFSYAELRRRIENTAAMLWERGMRPGMTIGMLVGNPAESYFAQLGAHLFGCQTMFLMRTSPPLFLRNVLGAVDADLFIYDVEVAAELGAELAQENPHRPVLCIGAGGAGPDITDPPEVARLPFDPAEITTQPKTLFQTSGTTGTPKLMRHGQRFFRNLQRVSQFYKPSDGRPIRQLNASGTWHAGGQSATLMTWSSGGTVILHFRPELGALLSRMVEEKATSLLLSPTALYGLLDHPQLAEADLSHLYTVTISASAASPARLIQGGKVFGPALNVVYGMGELPFISVLEHAGSDAEHPERLSSCGKPWGDVRVEIRDPAGAALPAGGTGEIWVTSDLMIEGYVGNQEINMQNLVDGWLRTGDVGRFDADGYLYLLDRINDLINVKGDKVYSRAVEDALAEHPEVRHVAVIAVPDDVTGEAIHACVVAAPGATATADELRNFVKEKLSEIWAPREVEFVDELPLTEFGKVDKKELRARYLAQVR